MAGGINPFGFAVSAPQPAPRAPIDLPSAPFGFAPPPSKWEQTAAILNEYNPIDAFWRLYNSDMAKGGAITDQNIEDGMMVGGTVMGGGAMIPKPANALNMGIRAYHGSPHSFDKFSMDKIGTGEGAQAYGHGLYFAENEGVAKGYRDALTNRNIPQGKHIEKVAFNVVRNAPDRPDAELAPFVRNVYPDATDYEVSDALKVARANQQSGSMYEVNIDADPDTFLDWDKPLSEQPEAVQGFANSLKDKSFLARRRLDDTTSATGRDVWEKARNAFGVGNADAATKALAEAGIPGIKYLDAGSRGAGDGTRNYVVFDDRLISIVRKYGIAGASAMLGYNLLENVNPAQADELKRIEAGK